MKKTKKKNQILAKPKSSGAQLRALFPWSLFFYNGTVNLEISELLKKKQIGNKRPEDE